MALSGWTGQARRGMDWDGLDSRSEYGFQKFDIRHSTIAKPDQHVVREHADRNDNSNIRDIGIANKARRQRRKLGNE
jgi:hypothetical protein